MHNFTATIGEICYTTKSDPPENGRLINSLLEYLPGAQQSLSGLPLTLSHTNGKCSSASLPIHLTYQHWFLHIRKISHTLDIEIHTCTQGLDNAALGRICKNTNSKLFPRPR